MRGMENLVKQGMREGVFRHDMNPEIISIIFYRVAEGIIINELKLDKFSLMEIFENMALAHLRGICTPKGLEILNRLEKTHHILK
jgi:hypothetical protein